MARGCDFRMSEGAIAQLGERLLCKQEVVGSIPSGSTRLDLVTGVVARVSADMSWCRWRAFGCVVLVRK